MKNGSGQRLLTAAALAVMVGLPTGTGHADMIEGFPDVIICPRGDMNRIVYLDRTFTDGRALYRTLNDQVVEVGTDRVFRRENEPGCDGKTLDELRANGQTRTLSQ